MGLLSNMMQVVALGIKTGFLSCEHFKLIVGFLSD